MGEGDYVKIIGAIIIAVTLLLTSCTWQDVDGVTWHAEPVSKQRTTYTKGAYDACTVHNLRLAKGRGMDYKDPELLAEISGVCLRLAVQVLQLLGPERGINDIEIKAQAQPTPTPCGGCL